MRDVVSGKGSKTSGGMEKETKLERKEILRHTLSFAGYAINSSHFSPWSVLAPPAPSMHCVSGCL